MTNEPKRTRALAILAALDLKFHELQQMYNFLPMTHPLRKDLSAARGRARLAARQVEALEIAEREVQDDNDYL